MLGVVRLRHVLGRLAAGDLVPPHVQALVPGGLLPGAADHQHVLDGRAAEHGLVDGGLERGGLAAPVAAVGGDDHLGVGVLDPGGDGLGREPAEDHGVRGADAGAGEHRHRRLGDHRQVDRDPVALGHAQLGERVGGPGDLVLELGVGDRAAVAGLALEVDRDPVAVPGLDVPVHAVVGDVEFAVGEPLGERSVGPIERLGGLLGPAQALRLGRPEGEPVFGGRRVGVGVDIGGGGELSRRGESTLFLEQVGQALIAAQRALLNRVLGAGHSLLPRRPNVLPPSSPGWARADKGPRNIGVDLCPSPRPCRRSRSGG